MHGHRQAIANLAKNAADSYARGMKKALEEAPSKKPAKTKEADRRNDAGWILFCQLFCGLAFMIWRIACRRSKVPTQPVPAGLAE